MNRPMHTLDGSGTTQSNHGERDLERCPSGAADSRHNMCAEKGCYGQCSAAKSGKLGPASRGFNRSKGMFKSR